MLTLLGIASSQNITPDEIIAGNITANESDYVYSPPSQIDPTQNSKNVTIVNESDPVYWYNKGIDLFDQRIYDEAIKAYDEAIRCYKITDKLDPILAIAWYNKGSALARQGNYHDANVAYDNAINVSDEAIKLDPNLVPIYAETWNKKGIDFYTQENWAEAIKCYDEAVKLDPNYAEAWNNKGNALYEQGNRVGADEAYAEAIRLDPNLTVDWFNEGKTLLSQHDQYHAIEAFREFIEKNPQNATAWNYLGESLYLFSSGDDIRNEAIRAFDKSIELNPQNAAAWCNKGIVLRDNTTHEIHQQQAASSSMPAPINDPQFAGMYEGAIELFERALEIDPKYATAWVEKGITLEIQGKSSHEAIAAYEEAIRLDPNLTSAWIAKGELLYSNGFRDDNNYAEAVKSFDKAIDLDPLSKATWSGLHDALQGMNAYDEAYHIDPMLDSVEMPVRSDRTEAAYLDHENRNKRNLALDNTIGYNTESFSYEGWRVDFEVNQTNYTIKDLSDLYSSNIAALNGQKTSIYYTILRISSPEGVGNLKFAIMPVGQEKLFLSDPAAMYPGGSRYEIESRQEDNGTVALAMIRYTGYKSNPFENIRLTYTGEVYNWNTIR